MIAKNFLSEIEKKLYDLKRETLRRNKELKDTNTLIWMIDDMRNLVGKEMIKYIKTKPETPWEEIYERTEEIWTCCNKCGWCGYINKPDRDEPCPNCNKYDLSQRYIIAKIECQKCGDIHYALQGKLKCVECESEDVVIVRKMEVMRTVYGRFDSSKKIKTFGFKPWPKDKEGKLIC